MVESILAIEFYGVSYKFTIVNLTRKAKGYGNQPIRLPGLKPGVCSGLILSGAFYPDLKIGVWRRRTYQVLDKEINVLY
jgi:hypothetical protein